MKLKSSFSVFFIIIILNFTTSAQSCKNNFDTLATDNFNNIKFKLGQKFKIDIPIANFIIKYGEDLLYLDNDLKIVCSINANQYFFSIWELDTQDPAALKLLKSELCADLNCLIYTLESINQCSSCQVVIKAKVKQSHVVLFSVDYLF